ncbi:MAG: hypothetical protein JW925_07040 [Syntrophaceae bacterium]|nr:hypothetical protein [Syntrophaceae bacterium]
MNAHKNTRILAKNAAYSHNPPAHPASAFTARLRLNPSRRQTIRLNAGDAAASKTLSSRCKGANQMAAII